MNTALPTLVVGVVAVAVCALWYERTRPSARVLALVATLAALGTVGRLAFGFVPQVQPSTDIVLLAGLAIGAAPGFAVGALTALISSLAFGFGPWVAWQMLAWGLCGVLGAGLGTLLRGDVGRWSLAIAGVVAGAIYGIVLNLSTFLTFNNDTTWAGLALIFGSALPFDAVHMVGNAVFALAFGPAMLLAIRRARARREGRFVPAVVAGSRTPGPGVVTPSGR